MADAEVVEKSGGIEKVREILRKTIADRPDKVLFGTDWPMCKIEEHIELVKSLGLSEDLESGVFRENSKKIYKLSL